MKGYDGEKISSEDQHGLICLAAQLALEVNLLGWLFNFVN